MAVTAASPTDSTLRKAPGQPSAGSPPLRSCLYECSIMHHRLKPREHRFAYRIFMFYLDLDELDDVALRISPFSHNRWNLYSFRDDDHLPLPGRNLKERIVNHLAGSGIQIGGGRVMLLTLPRVLGYIFNPVSFYFCFDENGAPICALAEVGNTFREMKPYLLGSESMTADGLFRKVVTKHFYVSPFSGLELQFDFKLRPPGKHLDIHIDDRDGDERILLSALTGRRADLTTRRLAWFSLKYPFLTLKVIGLIHWHALLLWLKKVPFHRKSAEPGLQRDVYHPHPSISGKTP